VLLFVAGLRFFCRDVAGHADLRAVALDVLTQELIWRIARREKDAMAEIDGNSGI